MAGDGAEKYLSVEEANALLPQIEGLLQTMDRLEADRQEAADLVEDMEAYWGEALHEASNPDRERYENLQKQLEGLAGELDDHLLQIHDLGGHLKSLEQGLVDFYTIHEGRVVFLCWQRGEEAVTHYHDLETGFQGRKPLTSP